MVDSVNIASLFLASYDIDYDIREGGHVYHGGDGVTV